MKIYIYIYIYIYKYIHTYIYTYIHNAIYYNITTYNIITHLPGFPRTMGPTCRAGKLLARPGRHGRPPPPP